MTEPPQGPPPFDPAHPAVGSVQAWLNLGKQRTPQGEFLILTLRVPNATTTALLSKSDAQAWIDALQNEVDQMSSLVIAPPGAALPPLNGRPHG
jgi:hypothetical protein